MIKQEKDGSWLAQCAICSWKTRELHRKQAENRLTNHINTVHKEGRESAVKEKKQLTPPAELPPDLPSPIKEK
jgi:Zn-finger protein